MTRLLYVPDQRGVLSGALVLACAMSLLVACNTVGGAGQDIGAAGNAISGGAERTKQALPPSPGPNQ